VSRLSLNFDRANHQSPTNPCRPTAHTSEAFDFDFTQGTLLTSSPYNPSIELGDPVQFTAWPDTDIGPVICSYQLTINTLS